MRPASWSEQATPAPRRGAAWSASTRRYGLVGGGPTDVVKVTVFVTDIEDRAAIAEARRAYFGDHAPAATMVEVSALAVPGCVVEIEATAVLA